MSVGIGAVAPNELGEASPSSDLGEYLRSAEGERADILLGERRLRGDLEVGDGRGDLEGVICVLGLGDEANVACEGGAIVLIIRCSESYEGR
jgi:hypothetical protein